MNSTIGHGFNVCSRCAQQLLRLVLPNHHRILSSAISIPRKDIVFITSSCLHSMPHLNSARTCPTQKSNVNKIYKRHYNILGLGGKKSVSKAVSDAEKIVGYPTSFLSLRCLLSDEMSNIALHMRKLVGTKHPLLKTARGMVFDGNHNLQLRGLFVMLIAKAAGPNPNDSFAEEEMVSGVYPSQRSLAEIMEVIHTASLVHKGIVNLDSLLPEQGPEADMEFGNKMAVLCGDYLLASACTGLAKLGNPKVVEEVASSIGDIMTAEFTNYTDADGNMNIPESCKGLTDWLEQTYLSFGSLLAKSCRSAMQLAGHPDNFKSMAFAFGENASYVQQLAKDLKPFTDFDELLSLGLTSAPVLLYKERVSSTEFDHIQQLWQGGPANYQEIVSIVTQSGVLTQCKELLAHYRDKAVESLDCYADSEAKSALINMVTAVSQVK